MGMIMKKFRVLDLYCKAGGSAKGFQRCNFYVVGIDIEDQPRYVGDKFYKTDAIEYLLEYGKEFDLINASPPCQKYTKSAKQWRKEGKEYPDLIEKTRDALRIVGKPYVIENVPNAPLIDPIYLNGSYFGLLVHRPRFFETNFPIEQPDIPKTKNPIKMGRPIKEGDIIQPVGHFSGKKYAEKQMQIDWMTVEELANAIPPAYTEWIGKQWLKWWHFNNDPIYN
jgi:DNA (cytosine-5)-methyltransferase 1